MNRILRGAVVLAASALFVSGCNTEPEDTQGGDPTRIVANPEKIFVDQGATNTVLLRLVDQQGTALNSPITISDISPGISIAIDSLFRPTFNAETGELQADTRNTELRIEVSGVGLEAGSFTVSAGGISTDVPVIVLPLAIEGVLSDEAPDVGEPVTLTAPAGFQFNDDSEITFQTGLPAQIVSVDATTITFLAVPGSSGTMTITNVTPTYAPDLSLPFPNATTVDLTDVSLLSSEDPNTAPDFNAPPVGGELFINDLPYATDQFYHIVITEPNTELDITVDWVGGDDIDFWLCDAACTNPGTPGGFTGASASHPEHDTVVFTDPGTYTLQLNIYSGAPPDNYQIHIVRLQ
jgi:hypothetical protein